jgi:hypothetical protein
VVGAGPPVCGRRRVRRDGRAQERGGAPGGRRGRAEGEQREEQERGRRRGEREEAAAAVDRVVVAPVAARHLVGASERKRRRDGDRTAPLDLALFFSFEVF